MAQDTMLSVWTTVDSKLKTFPVADGQVVFVRDTRQIAFDFDGQRVSYEQIIGLKSEQERQNILAPIVGSFYYVTETNALWTYHTTNGWMSVNIPETLTEEDIDNICI